MVDLNTSLSCMWRMEIKVPVTGLDVLYKEINRKKIPDVKTSLGEAISTDSTVNRGTDHRPGNSTPVSSFRN